MFDKVLIIYLIAVNAITFLTYGADKLKAVKNLWRIPEAVLLSLAFIGGSLGALLGMAAFRHKIRKPKFFICVPLFLILNIAAATALFVLI